MDNEKFNVYSSLIFVELLYTSKKFVTKLSENYSELHDIIKKLIESPSTENQEHIISLYSHNENNLKSFLHSYLKENESEFNWTNFLNKYEVTPVAGRFFKIDKTDQAYYDFVEKMKAERWVFSYMSVAVDADEYIIFFA